MFVLQICKNYWNHEYISNRHLETTTRLHNRLTKLESQATIRINASQGINPVPIRISGVYHKARTSVAVLYNSEAQE